MDADGIPLVVLSDGKQCHFPITVTQKALGHWDRWVIEKAEADKLEFLRLCDWLTKSQDCRGGWDTWGPLGMKTCSKYSSMTQAEAISALVRAWELTGQRVYKTVARKAILLFFDSIEDGGVTYVDGNDVFLEEVVAEPRSTILNGWIFSLFGLYDYDLAFGEDRVRELYRQSIDTLARCLECYDCGYWSWYDTDGRIASPFYHKLHVSQLDALSRVDGHSQFAFYRERWSRFDRRIVNRTRAITRKGLQKLREPARIVVAS